MKILAIRGQNLASLHGAFEIDLTQPPLSRLGLFAIAGPVGAGKSTLLDAMCLALFARTPRLSGRGGAVVGTDAVRTNDPRSLVRRGAATAFAEVDFRGNDGRTFRARWEVRRARGAAFGKLLADDHTLTCLATGQRMGTTNSETKKCVEDALGLGFDELCRSVLLSQGGFTAFLQAPAEERAALLERITGTEIYSHTSRLAFERAKREQLALQVLEEEHAALPPLAADARAELEERVRELTDDVARMDADVRARDRAIERHKDRRAREAAQKRARGQLVSAQEWSERARAAEEQVRADQESATPLLVKARSLDGQLAALDVGGARVRLAEADVAAKRAAGHVERVRGDRAMVMSEIARAEQILAQDPGVVGLVPAWDAVSADLARLAQIDTEIEGQVAITSTQSATRVEAERARAAIVAQLADADRAQLATELVVEERALARIERVTERFAERASLQDGEPCPLCGALDHPIKHELGALDLAARDAQRAAVAHLRNRIARLAELENERRDLDVQIADLAAQVAFLEGERSARKAERARVAAQIGRALADLALPAEALAQPRVLVRELAVRKQAVLGAQQRADAARRTLDASAAMLVDTERTAAAAHERLEVLRRACKDAEERARGVEQQRKALFNGAKVDDIEAVLAQRQSEARTASDDARAALAAAEEAVRAADAEIARIAVQEAEEDVSPDENALYRARLALAATQQAQADARAKLGADDIARERRDELAPRIEAQRAAAHTWAQLSQLIGSADGARFRVFAQSLTLDTLVHHANQHLRALAPRYRLERMQNEGRAKLELCVVDKENGDDLRGVQSLSGGESFLVSLALALGLSSLSSATAAHTHGDASGGFVGTLFIDEGFSSLDPDTLEVALAAFEALQQSGRQIGVISHLPALAERIGTQVRVVPLGEGRSRVDVKAG